jgi:hypothetical protein
MELSSCTAATVRGTAIAAFALVTMGCTDEASDPVGPGDGDPPTSVTFAGAVQPIFTSNCAFAGCHAGAAPQMGMDLSAGAAYANIVGVGSVQLPSMDRVEPGQPDSSYLVLKLEGRAGTVGGVGTRMPLGGQLTTAQIDTIRVWISGGALEN